MIKFIKRLFNRKPFIVYRNGKRLKFRTFKEAIPYMIVEV